MTEVGMALSNSYRGERKVVSFCWFTWNKLALSFVIPLSNFQGSVGGPLPSVEVRIVNNGKVVTEGTPGELHIKGPSVFQGCVSNILVTVHDIYTVICALDIGTDPKSLRRASLKMAGSELEIQQVCLRFHLTSTCLVALTFDLLPTSFSML